jgi:methylenetetrahydrofolate dehydrogenase (NADP+) / methenyltetrahydrofolate cyclohydrolase
MRIDGREIAEKLFEELKDRIWELKKKAVIPHLVVILVGENPASVAYVTLKQQKGEAIGAKVTLLKYKTDVTTEKLTRKIKELNDDKSVHGILIQRPLPEQIDIEKLELLTRPEKDIDGFHPDSPFTLPLPLAVVKILEEVYKMKFEARNPKSETNLNIQNKNDQNVLNLENSDLDIVSSFDSPRWSVGEAGIRYSDFSSWLKSQKIVVLGKGPTGGGPIIQLLNKLGVNPDIIDSKTDNPEELMKSADIIISSVGRENVIKPENIKKGVVLIGVGILRGEDKKLKGDYDVEKIKDIAGYYTPTPGGVGPVNVAMLLDNLLTAAERQSKSQ